MRCYMRARTERLSKKTCTSEGCGRVRFRRMLCRAHYNKFRREKGTKWPTCSVQHCFDRPKKGSRYCSSHDSVYGVGVSKHTRQSLTRDEILRSVIATQKVLQLANFPVLELGSLQPT